MVLVDTNVVVDVWQDHAEWYGWSAAQLRAQSQVHELAINPIIYAELSLSYESIETLDARVADLKLALLELPRAALFLAGQALRKYRRAGGSKSGVLPDFFIGAHAAVLGCAILTRNAGRYRSYFPTVELVAPRN
ncbi:MAG: PIN domain-containing protein [Lysobacterales bacterium]|nr:MAG: PIN domain-containing protein [Xanthomonadales bacterium]